MSHHINIYFSINLSNKNHQSQSSTHLVGAWLQGFEDGVSPIGRKLGVHIPVKGQHLSNYLKMEDQIYFFKTTRYRIYI